MEIIKPGQLPATRPPNHVGAVCRCKHCGAQFKLDAKDRIITKREAGKPDRRVVRCPTAGCGQEIDVPVMRQQIHEV